MLTSCEHVAFRGVKRFKQGAKVIHSESDGQWGPDANIYCLFTLTSASATKHTPTRCDVTRSTPTRRDERHVYKPEDLQQDRHNLKVLIQPIEFIDKSTELQRAHVSR